ncbi:DEAD/DEAH box helicase [Candidatus Woesearchaeota archaeon]|nr:DEAD/DEAH box helicase [Candidatus Woesearchaeota archaeon]
MKFEELGVNTEIVRALHEMGIDEPTTIQSTSIPIIKSGSDLIGMSKTGSGKTAAFAVPIIEKIAPGKGPQVLIMTPTRELAVQIAGEIKKFSKYTPRNVATVFGGVGLGPQIEEMNRSDIIVSTPGRMLDHLRRRNVTLPGVRHVVLDEADKMVEMGFIEDVDQILQATPKNKQVLLFGATLSEEIDRLKQRHMHNPQVAKADRFVKEEYLEQYYYNIEPFEKFSLLVHLLKNEDADRSIIFCAKRSTVEILTKNLKSQGIKAEMLHGKLTQNRRLDTMERFRKSGAVLVASAVAARGLDIKDVTHVFNYELSQDPQEYIHRVGRTARAGESGKAITLLSPSDHDAFSNVLRYYDINVKVLPKIEFPKLRFEAPRRGARGGRFGGRPMDGRRSGPSTGGRGRWDRNERSNSYKKTNRFSRSWN